MTPEDELVRDVFAHYGLAAYQASCVEHGLAILLALISGSDQVHRWVYDHRLSRNLEDTFGGLVVNFLKIPIPAYDPIKKRLAEAVKDRNWLIHHYFWDRAIEFPTDDGCKKMIKELVRLATCFSVLDADLDNLVTDWARTHGVSAEDEKTALQRVLDGKAPLPIRQEPLEKRVTVIAAYQWRPKPESTSRMPLLKTNDGQNLLLSEGGICKGPPSVSDDDLELITKYSEAFPATINPTPKNVKDWTYTIPLAMGYELWACPGVAEDRIIQRWGIRRLN